MKSVKVNGLLEEIGTLYEDGLLVIENMALVKDEFVAISKDIIVRLNSGKIMCGKMPCKKIRITLNESFDEVYETTMATFLTEGMPIQNDEPKLSLHLEKWQHEEPLVVIPNQPEIKKTLKQILAELKIEYLEAMK